jgi:hypothetical protein
MIRRFRILLPLLCSVACEHSAKRQSTDSSAVIVTQPAAAPEAFNAGDGSFDAYEMPAPDSSWGTWGADKFFSASHVRHPSGLLVMWLDTAVRATEDHPVGRAHADSVVVQGILPGEFLARYCMMGGSTIVQAVGIIRDTTQTLTRPRLAWLFDNSTFHIKPLPTDSLTCMLHEPIDEGDD